MKLKIIAATAILALTACGQSTDTTQSTTATATTPQGLMEQIQAQSPEQQPVAAWQQLITHPETMPACHSIRRAEVRGVVPANVAPNTPYSGHAGELAFSIQCGAQLTTVHDDPHEHWIVFFAPGATTSTIANCAGSGRTPDQCAATAIPTAAAPAATTTP